MSLLPLCSVADLPPGNRRALRVGGEDLLLINVAGEIHALENSCLHGGAALAGGCLDGRILSCPAHGWRYDVVSGALCVAPEKKLRKFPVTIADGKVLVEIAA